MRIARTRTPLLLIALVLSFSSILYADHSEADLTAGNVAKHIAERYELYDDAREYARMSISEPEYRSIVLASIWRIEGQKKSGVEGDHAIGEARTIYEQLQSIEGQVAHVRFEYDVIDARGPTESDRITITTLLEKLTEVATVIGDRKKDNLKGWINDTILYESEMSRFLLQARANMLLAKIESPASESRSEYVEKVEYFISEQQWEKDAEKWAASIFDGYFLKGDAYNLINEPQKAVRSYMDLVSELDRYPRSNPVVQAHCMNAYVQVVETLITRMGSVDALEQAKAYILEAFSKFPTARDTESGRQLRMYEISIDIKLTGSVNEPLKRLLELAKEGGSAAFLAAAASEIARVAKHPELTPEQRLQCVKVVSNIPMYQANLLAISTLHTLLSNLHTEKEFESYAPYCYAKISIITESLGRYMESALIMREAADRFNYLRTKNPSWEGSYDKLPDHFYGADGKPRCAIDLGKDSIILASKGDAFEFPKLLAKRALRNAGFMIHKQHGDRNNKDFKDFYEDLTAWNSQYLGDIQLYLDVRKQGIDAYTAKRNVEAAQLLLTTLASSKDAINDSYYAGQALFRMVKEERPRTDIKGIFNWRAFYVDGYQHKTLDFKGQIPRIDEDLSELSEPLRENLRAHLVRLNTAPPSDGVEYLWELSLYSFKRSIALLLQGAKSEIEGKGRTLEGKTFAQAIYEHGMTLNSNLREGSVAESGAIPVADSLNFVISLLRAPFNGEVDRARAEERKTQLKEERAEELKALIDVVWEAYGPQIIAEFKNGDEESHATAFELIKNLLPRIFTAYLEAGEPEDVQKAVEAFNTFKSIYDEHFTDEERASVRENMEKMLRTMRGVLFAREKPVVDGLLGASSILEAATYNLTRGGLFALAERDVPNYNSLSAAEYEKQVGDYIRNWIYSRVYAEDAAAGKGSPNEIKIGAQIPREYATAFEAKWKELVDRYRRDHLKMMQVEGERMLGDENLKPANDAIKQAMGVLVSAGGEAALKKLSELSVAEGADPSVAAARFRWERMGELFAPVRGEAFREELNDFLYDHIDKFNARAAVAASRWLDARDLHLAFTGEERFPEQGAKGLGQFYSVIAKEENTRKSWNNAFSAWEAVISTREGVGNDKFGDPSFIATRDDNKSLTNDETLANEIEIRFEYALAAWNLYNLDGAQDEELLSKVLHNARRLYNIIEWRNAIETSKDDEIKEWRANLNDTKTWKQIEKYYVGIASLYTDIAMYYASNGKTPEWKKKYYQQRNKTITKAMCEAEEDESKRFYALPETGEDFLNEVIFLQNILFHGFREKFSTFNGLFQRSLKRWAEVCFLKAKLMEATGDDDKIKAADDWTGAVLQTTVRQAEGVAYLLINDSGKRFAAVMYDLIVEANALTDSSWSDMKGITTQQIEAVKKLLK